MKSCNEKGQERREQMLDRLAETLERVAEGREERAALESCLARFDEADLPAADPERALERFREKHETLMSSEEEGRAQEKRHPARKYLRRAAAVAVAAVLLCAIYIAGASDEGSSGVIGRWTDETFHFGGVGKERTSEETAAGTDENIEGDYPSIEAALSACGITQTVFPKWIPERFHLENIHVRQLGTDFRAVRAEYSRAGTTRICSVDIMKFDNIADAYSCVFEKDDTPVVEYERGGIIHYLVHNPAGDAAIWNNENLVCSIIGDLTAEEFRKSIDSIYEE